MEYILLASYSAVGILTYGLTFAYWQRNFEELATKDYAQDRGRAILGAIIWPCALPALLMMASKEYPLRGLKFR